jgi:hypothetical protein
MLFEMGNGLGIAVFSDREVRGREAGDRMAGAVGDDDIEQNLACGSGEGRDGLAGLGWVGRAWLKLGLGLRWSPVLGSCAQRNHA